MSTSKVPQLPPTGEATRLRYEVNPAIALNELTDIYKQVQRCQGRLRQLAHEIHQVYAEGPVVSGWLASEASLTAAAQHSNQSVGNDAQSFSAALFRHGDADDLMQYLSALENSMSGQARESQMGPEATDTQPPQSRYYLCQLNSSGQIESEPCPPEQVPVLSMAIARYQRLNQLIKQKQTLETKLQAIVDILSDAKRVLGD
ncbi:MAG: hypothetical protein AAF808_08790 [Cyanobacteria bacterium P01_D01_bin.2]